MLRPALLSLTVLGLAAQTPAPKPEPKPAAAPVAKALPSPAAAPKAEAPKEDVVIAKIDGVAIRESEMNTMLGSLSPQQKQSMQGQDRAKMVDNYLEFRLLVAKAKRMGLDKSPDYKHKLELNSYQLLASELLSKEGDSLKKKTEVSDDEVKAYFEANKDSFKSSGKFNARHILVKTKGGPNADQGLTEEDAKKKMAEIKAEFDKGGKWEALATKYSEDPGSKDKGGLYEGIAFGQFVPEFEAAVKKQAIGKVGEPVKSTFGYHLIQVESLSDSESPTFEAVKEQVKQRATQIKQEMVWKDYIKAIKAEVPMSVMSEAPKDSAAVPAAKPAAKPAAAPAPKPAAAPAPK